MPITQDYLAGVIEDFERQAATLNRIAQLGRKQAKRSLNTGDPGETVRENLRRAHKRALSINARFEDFIRPLVFTDPSAHHVVTKTKTKLHKAVKEIRDVIRLIEDSYRYAHKKRRGVGRINGA